MSIIDAQLLKCSDTHVVAVLHTLYVSAHPVQVVANEPGMLFALYISC